MHITQPQGVVLPAYMLDIPARGKVPVGPSYIAASVDGGYQVTDPAGEVIAYADRTGDRAR